MRNDAEQAAPYQSSLKERAQRRFVIGQTQSPGSEMRNYQLGEAATPKVLFTVNHVDKRLKGFVDFDLQMSRPEIPASNAHDQRFEPYNHFPAHYSSTLNSRIVNFEHYPARNDKTYKVNMSEPLFDRDKHLNLYKPKATGILQFGKMDTKKNFITTQTVQSAPVDPIMPSLEGHSRKKAILAILAASNKKNDLEKQEKIPDLP